MKKYNYVYRITNKVEQKYYYGVRGCNVEPKLDLGIKYFSSSSDKEFKDDQKNHPENYKYKIVRICSTSDEADTLEIKLHEKFDVGKSEAFYNKATRTSMGFSTAGTNISPEHKQKLSEAKLGVPKSDEHKQKLSEAKLGEKNPMFGKEFSPEHRQKLSEANKGEKNPNFGKERSDETKQKMSEAKKGVPLSPEHRQKMSEAHKGVLKSDETRKKMSEAMKGKELSPEHKQKLSEAAKGIPKGPQEQVECPHCGKIGGKNLMSRYHFDNCKYKEVAVVEEADNVFGRF